jgi:protein TonB
MAAAAVLHVALALSLLHFDDVHSAAQTTVMVSLIDSAGAQRAAPPKRLSKTTPAPQPPVSASPPATEAAAQSPPHSAPDAPASESAVVLPRFDANYLNNPKPAYPLASRRLGEQGRVILRVSVRADGTPAEVTLDRSSGSTRLDQAALEAVRQWRFIPARRGDTAVAESVRVPISFSLEG